MTVTFSFQKNEVEGSYYSRYVNRHYFFVGCCLFIFAGFRKNLKQIQY